MFQLKQLLSYEELVIQCHDNPDADTLACGYALYVYLKSHSKQVRLIYGGPNLISKPNLLIMIDKLSIPIEHVTYLEAPDLLITVDCQYGESNVHLFPAKNTCIIDHHISPYLSNHLHIIRSELVSCSTLVWELLQNVDFDFSHATNVMTALYYGLLTDSNSFTEISHPLDLEMQSALSYDASLIKELKHSNLSLFDLSIASKALIPCLTDPAHKFAIFKSTPCDPNILGFISDLVIQVDTINLCIVYFVTNLCIKFSIRSSSDNVNAHEFAKYLCKHIGSGGGHADKAGGLISLPLYTQNYPNQDISQSLHTVTIQYLSHIKSSH